MRPTKIVIIGAASACFGPGCIRDAINCEGIRGSRLVLVDIDNEALAVMARFAHTVNDAADAGLVIEHTTDRTQALPDAEFVITCIAIKRNDLWKLDWEIPLKYDIKHVLGENGGPGGLSHSLRNIPVILDICRDMDKLCPDAWLLNFTNPESRMCLAISKYSQIKAAGLCHGLREGGEFIRKLCAIEPAERLRLDPAGLNHFAWAVHLTIDGRDGWPVFRAALKRHGARSVSYTHLTLPTTPYV